MSLEPKKSPETKKVESKRETGTRLRSEKDYSKRAAERLQRGDLDGAIADYSKAIELNPACGEAYVKRGVARERKGDVSGAKADYAKSIEIELHAEIERQLSSQEEGDVEEGPPKE